MFSPFEIMCQLITKVRVVFNTVHVIIIHFVTVKKWVLFGSDTENAAFSYIEWHLPSCGPVC